MPEFDMETRSLAAGVSRVDRRILSRVGPIDLVLIASLTFVGRVHHGYPLVSRPLETIETMLPFVIGWALVAILAGTYRRGALESATQAGVLGAVTWLGAANIGLILRSSPWFEGSAVWPFNFIMTAIGVAALVAWRVVAVRWVAP